MNNTMDMNKKMKQISFHMNILMGFVLSLCLSITNTLSSEKPSINTWLISFGTSALISFVIGFLIPIRKLEIGAAKAMKIKPDSLPSRLIGALISDIIYTPIITLAMVLLVRIIVTKASHGHAQFPPFPIMYIKSFIFSFIISYCVVYLVNHLILKFVFKMNGIDPRAAQPTGKKPE